jgi:hypothetical protein
MLRFQSAGRFPNIEYNHLETGFGGRPSQVIYNRNHSAITRLEIDEVDWDAVFDGATWLHISGITLALGKKVREAAFRAVEEAKKRGAHDELLAANGTYKELYALQFRDNDIFE